MAGKRHHYLPAFLLRRFAEPAGKREGLVWRLDKVSGQPRAVAPRKEAALPHYYRIENSDETTDSRFEDVLGVVENSAASTIRKLEDGVQPTIEERAMLAFFVVLQRNRTPVARNELRFRDELVAGFQTEINLEDAERFHAQAKTHDPNASDEEIESTRLELLEELRSGNLKIESTPSREVASMFLAADKVAEQLVAGFSWAVLRAPDGVQFVLPDMGLTIYDPSPRVPGSGAFMSSPNAETVIPVDPSFAIALMPGRSDWGEGQIDASTVEEINLRAYAWSNAAVYGRSQKVVCDLRSIARRRRQKVGTFKPRPGRIWITEGEGDRQSGPMEFVGYSPKGTTRQRFFVHPAAHEEQSDS